MIVNKSPAKLFLSYVIVGLGSLLLIIFLSRIFQQPDQPITIYLAIAISTSNLLAVLGYTRAILRDDDLLADQDAPDLAYYLGFSLTVGALSVSFLSDIWMSGHGTDAQKALIDRSLVKGSLAQFGAGLLATLFGLSAKIYIASQQFKTQLDPDDLYRKFRIEVGSFSDLLRQVSADLNMNVRNASNEISEAGKSAAQAFQQMSAVISDTTKEISENFSQDKISLPVQKFSSQLVTLTEPLVKFNQELESFAEETSQVNNSIKSLNSEILKFDKSILDGSNSIDKFSSSIELSETKIDVLGKKIDNFSDANDRAAQSVNRLGQASEAAIKEFEGLSASASICSDSIKQVNTSLNALTAAVIDTNSSCSSLHLIFTGLSEIVQKSGVVSSEFTNYVQTSSSIVSAFGTTLNKASNDISLLTDSIASMIERLNTNVAAAQQSSDSLFKLNQACLAVNSSINELNSASAEISEKLKHLGFSLISISDGAKPFGENLLRLSNPLDEVKTKINEFSIAVTSAASTVEKLKNLN